MSVHQTVESKPQPAGGSAGKEDRSRKLDAIAERVRKAGKIELAKLAQEFNYSYYYFKYFVIKEVMARHTEIYVVIEEDGEYVVWDDWKQGVEGG